MATVLFTPCSLLPVPITGFLYTLTTDTLYKHVNMQRFLFLPLVLFVTWIICWSVFLIGYWSHHWALEKDQEKQGPLLPQLQFRERALCGPFLLFWCTWVQLMANVQIHDIWQYSTLTKSTRVLPCCLHCSVLYCYRYAFLILRYHSITQRFYDIYHANTMFCDVLW